MTDISRIFDRYYSSDEELRSIVITHSESVAALARECIVRNGIVADLQFIEEAAMLHDIGVVSCNAPSIKCRGSLPYICHGIEGRRMLENEGMPRHALVCERHTGAGLSADDIISQQLPLPVRDMLPLTIEEKAICYADKFFSKSGNLTERKPLARVLSQMEAHGTAVLDRFLHLHSIFAIDSN